LYNNTVYGTDGQGIVIDARASGTIVRNNISYNSPRGNYLNYGRDTSDSNNLTSDPGFVDPGNANFKLSASSRAIDAGVYVGAVQSDKLGVPRPQGATYDIGAYEFQSGGTTPATPVNPPAPQQPPAPAPAPPTSPTSTSPSGTKVPGVAAIVDSSLAVWTLGNSLEVFRNGAQAAGGYATQILWYGGSIFVLGDDNNWWRWTGSTWTFQSSYDPSGS
jgi:hypothetical protein